MFKQKGASLVEFMIAFCAWAYFSSDSGVNLCEWSTSDNGTFERVNVVTEF